MLDAQSPMKNAFARMTSVKTAGSGERVQQALGWESFRFNGNEMLGHSGGTLGFETRLVVDTTRRRVVLAWANGRSGNGVTDLVGLAINRPVLQ
jgi:hypothetical protein